MFKRRYANSSSALHHQCQHIPVLERRIKEASWSNKKLCRFCGTVVVPSNKYVCASLLLVFFVPLVYAAFAYATKHFTGYRALSVTIGVVGALLYLFCGDRFVVQRYYARTSWIAPDRAEIVLGKKRINIRNNSTEKRCAILALVLGVAMAICLHYILVQIVGNV